MQLLSDIVRDTDENFGLGNRAAVLVLEAAKSLFDSRHGGLKGFMDRLESEGLASDLANWRTSAKEIRFPEGLWVDKVLGVETITRIGRDLGMANARVRTALAYVIPHLIRYFAAGSTLPDQLPPAVEDYLVAGRPEHLAPRSRGIKKSTRNKKHSARRDAGAGNLIWAGGVVALLISGFLLGRDVLTRSQPTSPASSAPTPTPEIAAKDSVAVLDKAPDSQSPVQPVAPEGPGSRLVLRSYGNQIEFLGFVNTPEMRTQLLDKLQKSFGAARLVGDVIIDPDRAEPIWIAQLDRLLPLVSVPGLDIRLEGNTVRVGGWLAEEDRTSVLNNLMSALGSTYRFGYLRDEEVERVQDSRQFLLAALARITPAIRPQELVLILNRWVIDFPEGSAVFPDDAKEVLARVADALKLAKPQSVIEIQGHVDADATAGAAQRLSLERANAVRDALIKAGVSSGMLRTKGYGSEKRLAMGGAPFDHHRNQRIEFRVIQVCDAYFPCELTTPLRRVPAPDPNLPLSEPSSTVGGSAAPADTQSGMPAARPALHPSELPGTTTAPAAGLPRGGSGHADEGDGTDIGSGPTSGSKLKALSEDLPPPPKPKAKPVTPPKPPAAKPEEWYDPLGLF